MPATLDHLLFAGADLGRTVALLQRRSGVRAAAGGSHPELGTHNALARLGRGRFLELLAPDPAQAGGRLASQLAALHDPVLLMWAARVRSAEAEAERARQAGYHATVVPGQRTRGDGTVVRWTNVFVAGHGAGTMVPFFIEWPRGAHPASDAPAGLTLVSFHLETPRPETLRLVLDALDVRVAVRPGAQDRLVALVDSPRGRFTLAGP